MVVSAVPFQLTFEVETKPLPDTVRVSEVEPALAELGEMAVTAGAGLLMVNATAELVPPPGADVTTVTDAVPAVASIPVSIVALSWVLLT